MSIDDILRQIAAVPGATETPMPPQTAFVMETPDAYGGAPTITEETKADATEIDPATGKPRKKRKSAFETIGEAAPGAAKAFTDAEQAAAKRTQAQHQQYLSALMAMQPPQAGGSLFVPRLFG